MDIESLEEKLFASKDGSVCHSTLKKLEKILSKDREKYISILAKYSKEGPLGFIREHTMSKLADVVEEGERKFSELFLKGLNDKEGGCVYWAVNGLIKTSGKDAYKTLTEFALDSRKYLDARANAIKCLADDSSQTFIKGLTTDPGNWKENEFPLKELKEWAQKGFPKGRGFEPPTRHPALDKPKTELEKVAAALDKKLAKTRAEEQDLSNPDNWLVPADSKNLKTIQSKWELPKIYLEFLSKFSPLNVVLSAKGIGADIEVFGASNLIEGQNGYSFNSVTKKLIMTWPKHYVVIANESGDPYVLDLSATKDGDAPVLNAAHGQGEWDFTAVTPTFLKFLEKLAK